MHRLSARFVVGLVSLFLTPSMYAQLAPEIGYIQPAGVQAGTTVDIILGGYDWTPDMQLFPHDPRVKLELVGPPSPVLVGEPPYWFGAKGRGYAWPLPREFRARLTVPADVSPGLIKWQAANANGVSPIGVIHVSHVPEVVEGDQSQGPQVLPQLPVCVSGQIRRISEVDRYEIFPTQSGPVTIELLARQLTSPTNPMSLHGMLQVLDATGRRLVDVSSSEGRDLTATFAAEANQKYLIQLHDLDFAGDRSYVYRLLITPGPGLVAAYPSAGRRGETRDVEFVGWGVATCKAELESVIREVSFPVDGTASEFAYILETPFGTTKPYRFELSDAPELVEGAPLAALPCAVTGVLDARFGSDTYGVTLKKGDVWQIAARSRTLGLPLDLELSIAGPDGKELAAADDGPQSTDPELTFTAPEEGNYRFVVSDRSGHSGGRGAAYRLSIEHPQEDLSIMSPDLLSVPIGATGKFSVQIARRGGFKGAVTLALSGLPRGLSVPEPLIVAEDKSELVIDVTCVADAAATAELAELSATATLNGVSVVRPVKSLVAAAVMKPRIKITPEGLDDVSKVRRGSTHLFPLLIERLEGFTGEITLEMTAKQQRHRQGLASEELVVPAEARRVEYPIFVPEWLETTKTSRMILNGAVRVPDPQGHIRTLLQRMELRVGILPMGALMKLAHAPDEYQAVLGGELTLPLVISRAHEFRESIRVELAPGVAQSGLISAEPITLAADDRQPVMTVRFSEDAKLLGEQTLLIRATALQDGNRLVKSETRVVIDVLPK